MNGGKFFNSTGLDSNDNTQFSDFSSANQGDFVSASTQNGNQMQNSSIDPVIMSTSNMIKQQIMDSPMEQNVPMFSNVNMQTQGNPSGFTGMPSNNPGFNNVQLNNNPMQQDLPKMNDFSQSVPDMMLSNNNVQVEQPVIQLNSNSNGNSNVGVDFQMEEQPTIMMDSDVSAMEHSQQGVNPVFMPEEKKVSLQKNIKMDIKLKINFKKILIICGASLALVVLFLSLFGYKSVTCTGSEVLYGTNVDVNVKANFWLGKINKITTIKVSDLSPLNKNDQDKLINLYKEKELSSEEKIDIKDLKITSTIIIRPKNSEEANMSKVEFVESYEKLNFICK